MADSTASVKPPIILKYLVIDPQANGEDNIAALKGILVSLQNSNFQKLTILDPIYMRFGQNQRKLEAGEYSITTEDRGLFNETNQESRLFYTDVAFILFQIKSWLLGSPKYRELYGKTLANGVFACVDWGDNESFPQFKDDFVLITQKSNDLKEVIQILLGIFNLIHPDSVDVEGDKDSLADLIYQLKVRPEIALLAWDSDLIHVTTAFNETSEGEDHIRLQSSAYQYFVANNLRLSVSEVRLLHHWLIMGLREILKDSSKIPGKNKSRPLTTILTNEEIKAIEQSDELLFPETTTALQEFTSAEEKTTITDVRKGRALFDFLIKQGVMDRLLGKKELPTGTYGSAAGGSAEDGGESPSTKDAEPTKLITIDEVKERLITKVVRDIYVRLGFPATLSLRPDRIELEALLVSRLRLDVLAMGPLALDASTLFIEIPANEEVGRLAPETISLIDSETGLVITNDYFDEWFDLQVDALFSAFTDALDNQGEAASIEYAANLLSEAEQTLPEFDLTAEESEEKVNTDQAQVRADIVAGLKEEYRNSHPDPENNYDKDWWESLTPQERLARATQELGGEIRLQHIQQILLVNEFGGLTLESLTATERAQLDAALNSLLLDYETFIQIKASPYAVRRLIAHKLGLTTAGITINKKYNPDPVTQTETRKNQLETQRTEALAELQNEFSLSKIDIDNVMNGLDSLLLLSRDPSFLIDSLDRKKLLLYFNITLSEDLATSEFQLLNIKNYLRRYIVARQEEFRLDFKTKGTAESEEDLEYYYDATRDLIVKHGVQVVAQSLTQHFEDHLSHEAALEEEDDDRRAYQIKVALITALWAQLDEDQRLAYMATLGATGISPSALASPALTPEGIPEQATAAGLMKSVNQAQKIGKTPTLRNRLTNALQRKSPVENLKKQAMQQVLNKLAGAIPVAGGIITAAQMLKDLTGMDWSQLLMVGGAALGAVGAAIAGLVQYFISNPLVAINMIIGGGLMALTGGSAGMVALGAGAGGVTSVIAKETGRNLFASASATAKSLTPQTIIGSTPQIGAIVGTAGFCAATIYTAQQLAFMDPLPTLIDDTTSKYVSITKTADVGESLTNEEVPKDVTYTITITPKGDYTITPTLETTTDVFSYIGGSDHAELDPTNSRMETIRSQLQTPIPPGETRTITYTVRGVSGKDVMISNQFTLAFSAADPKEQKTEDSTLKASYSITIGNPKVGCFIFAPAGTTTGRAQITSKTWTEDEKKRIYRAFSRAGQNATFNTLTCAKGDITLYRLSGSEYGGWAISSNEVGMYDLGMTSEAAAEYTLIHEMGHIMDHRNPHLRTTPGTGFNAIPGSSVCPRTYPATCNQGEPFAESVVLHVIYKSYKFGGLGGTLYNFPSENPAFYAWVKENIYGGQEF